MFAPRYHPPMVYSFVKPRSQLFFSEMGAGIRQPRMLHVPQLMYAQWSPSAGTAATAAEVSCPQVVTTGTGPRPVSCCTVAESGPRTVPGSTSGANIFAGRWNASMIRWHHCPSRPIRFDVLAMERSLTLFPVRKYPKRSGVFRKPAAAARSGEPSLCIERSWKSELIAHGSYAVRA